MQRTKVNWTVSGFVSEKKRIDEILAAQYEARDPALLAFLMHGYAGGEDQDQSMVLMIELIYVIKALEFHLYSGGLTEAETNRVFETGERILKAANIDYSRSQLSFLYRMLYQIKSAIAAKNGEHNRAAWIIEAAEHLCYRPDGEQRRQQETLRARRLLRLGQAGAARDILLALEFSGTSDEDLYLLARSEWLCGNIKIAMKRLQNKKESQFFLMAGLLNASLSGEYRPFYNEVRRIADQPQSLIFSTLWLYAPVGLAVRPMALKSGSLRKKFSAGALKQQQASLLIEALAAAENAYDNAIPLISRLNQLGDIFARRNDFLEIEHEMIYLAICARHAARYSQTTLTDMLVGEYRSMSAAMMPMGHDVLGVLSDLTQRETMRLPEIVSRDRNSQASGKLVRTAKAAALIGKGMSMWTTARLRGMIAGENARRQIYEHSQQQFGEHALMVMGDLKGGFMKLGQIIASAHELPENVRDPMKGLHNRAEMTDPKMSRQIIEAELGGPVEQFFQEWSEQPFAVGSIGQVFRARTLAGDDVAVKVQHPGIEDIISRDLATALWLKPILKHFLPKADHSGLIEEVSARIMEETDYRIELKNQQQVRQCFNGDMNVMIPAVFPELSSKKVLTSEFVKGQEFHDFVEQANQEERNHAADVIMRMVSYSLFQHHIFNADPHPGNYLFLGDGRIAFIDFGCTKSFSKELVRSTYESSRTILVGDAAGNRQAWIDLGYVPDPEKFDFNAIYQLFRAIYAPALTDKEVVFDRKVLAAISKVQLESPVGKSITPPPESAILVRFTWGVLSVLAQLEPKLNFYRMAQMGIASMGAEKGAT